MRCACTCQVQHAVETNTALSPRGPPKARHRQGSSCGEQGRGTGPRGSRVERAEGRGLRLRTGGRGPTAAHLLLPARHFPFLLKITPEGLMDAFCCCFNWSSSGRVFSRSRSWRSLRDRQALPHPLASCSSWSPMPAPGQLGQPSPGPLAAAPSLPPFHPGGKITPWKSFSPNQPRPSNVDESPAGMSDSRVCGLGKGRRVPAPQI